jgi:hypothetical protein
VVVADLHQQIMKQSFFKKSIAFCQNCLSTAAYKASGES